MISKIKMPMLQAFYWFRLPRKSWILNRENPQPIVLLLILLNLALTLPLAALVNIGIDDSFSLNTTSKDFGYTIYRAIQFEGQPPFYFALLHLWRSLNDSIFFAKLFSVFCISLTIYTTTVVSQRYLKKLHPGWIAAAVAFHPYAIWAALEIRMYAFAILISSLLLLFFFDGYLSDTPKARAKWLYALFSTVGLYTNYLLACLLISNALTLLILRRWRALYFYLLTMALVGFCFIPMLFILFFHVSRIKAVFASSSTSFTETFQITFGFVRTFIIPIENDETRAFLKKILQSLLGILAIIILLKSYRFISFSHKAIACMILTSTLVVVTVLDIMEAANIAQRYTYPLFILTLLSVFSIFSLIPDTRKSKILISWALIFLFVCMSSLFVTYKPLAKLGDWQRVASYIMANEKLGQTILVFPEHHTSALSYYYSGINTFVSVPRAMGNEKFDLSKIILKDEQEIRTALSNVPGKHQYLWIVNNFQDNTHSPNQEACEVLHINFNCQVLERFVAQYYTVEHNKDFYGSNVRLLHRKPE
jgi:hypothetical protein